jgi:hypothetical protein
MQREGRKEEYRRPDKELWNKYSLQSLFAKRFIEVTNKILKGEYRLLKS